MCFVFEISAVRLRKIPTGLGAILPGFGYQLGPPPPWDTAGKKDPPPRRRRLEKAPGPIGGLAAMSASVVTHPADSLRVRMYLYGQLERTSPRAAAAAVGGPPATTRIPRFADLPTPPMPRIAMQFWRVSVFKWLAYDK